MIAPQMLPSDLVVPTKPGWRIDIGDAGSAASPKPWHCASSRRSACVRPVSPRGKSLVRISARCVLSPVAPSSRAIARDPAVGAAAWGDAPAARQTSDQIASLYP